MKTVEKTTPMTIKLGERLKEIRLKRGHTSVEGFAFSIDVSRVLYANWEKGTGNPTFKNIVKVTRALDISLKEFFSKGFD